MDSGLIESLIEVLPSSEIASQRWRRLCGLVKNRKPSSLSLFNPNLSDRYDQQAPAASSNLMQNKPKGAIFSFEAVSAVFGQVSTPQKPQYSLYGMLLSIVAVLVSVLDLIHNALIQRRIGRLTSASDVLWGILPEIFGLALACIQCISSALQFSFLCRHAANPVKISLVPFLFFLVWFIFKYREGRS